MSVYFFESIESDSNIESSINKINNELLSVQTGVMWGAYYPKVIRV